MLPVWVFFFFSCPYLFAGHSPPLPERILHTPQRNPCFLTVPSHSQNTKAHLKVTQKELKDLQWEHEVLEQRFSKVRAARWVWASQFPLQTLSPPQRIEHWGLAESVLSRGLSEL